MYELWVVITVAVAGFICGTLFGMKYMAAVQDLDSDWRDWNDR